MKTWKYIRSYLAIAALLSASALNNNAFAQQLPSDPKDIIASLKLAISRNCQLRSIPTEDCSKPRNINILHYLGSPRVNPRVVAVLIGPSDESEKDQIFYTRRQNDNWNVTMTISYPQGTNRDEDIRSNLKIAIFQDCLLHTILPGECGLPQNTTINSYKIEDNYAAATISSKGDPGDTELAYLKKNQKGYWILLVEGSGVPNPDKFGVPKGLR